MTGTPIFDQLAAERGILSPADLGLTVHDSADDPVPATGALLEDGLRQAADPGAGLTAVYQEAASRATTLEPDGQPEQPAGQPEPADAAGPYARPPRRRWGRR